MKNKSKMKKIILLLSLFGITFGMKAQITELANGNVGIGTTNPNHKLDVNTGGGNFKTYVYGVEHTVNTTGGWARAFRLRNENDNNTTVFGALNGAAYISTGFDINIDVTGYQHQKFTVLTNGNVGIGTANPNHMLDINTGGGNFKTYVYGVEHTVNTTGGWARAFRLRNENDNNTTVFGALNGAAYISTGFDINTDATGYQHQKFTVLTNGNVGIGTTDTKGFKLGVKGQIAAEEVKVAMYANWPDFVFKQKYNLPTLGEVESHIKEKGHLKDIPSAKEVKENGIFLGEMNSKLLQKIEELTLYTIQQEKEIKELKNLQHKVQTLERENITLKVMNSKLIELQVRLEKLEKK